MDNISISIVLKSVYYCCSRLFFTGRFSCRRKMIDNWRNFGLCQNHPTQNINQNGFKNFWDTVTYTFTTLDGKFEPKINLFFGEFYADNNWIVDAAKEFDGGWEREEMKRISISHMDVMSDCKRTNKWQQLQERITRWLCRWHHP